MVTQIVDADIVEPGAGTDAPPGVLQIGDVESPDAGP